MLTDLSLTTNNMICDEDLFVGNFQGKGVIIKTAIINNLLGVSGSDGEAGEFVTADIPETEVLYYLYKAIIEDHMQVQDSINNSKEMGATQDSTENLKLKPTYLQLLYNEDEPEPEPEPEYDLNGEKNLVNILTTYSDSEPTIWTGDDIDFVVSGMFYYVDEFI